MSAVYRLGKTIQKSRPGNCLNRNGISLSKVRQTKTPPPRSIGRYAISLTMIQSTKISWTHWCRVNNLDNRFVAMPRID